MISDDNSYKNDLNRCSRFRNFCFNSTLIIFKGDVCIMIAFDAAHYLEL